MSSVNPEKINLSEYEEYYPKRSSNEAWNHVKRYRKVTQEGGYTEIWICNYCNRTHTGNVGRVEAHLAGIKVKGVTYCPEVPLEVKEKMRRAVRGKDVDLRETKRRNLLPYSLQSKSSGLNPIAEGNPSHSTLLGISEVSPQYAEMGVGSFADPHGFTEHLPDTVRQITASGLENSQLNSVEGGGNISNTARLEQHSGEISMVDIPTSLRSRRLPIFEEMEILGSGATSGQGADADSSIGLGSSPLNPEGEAGRNHSNFTGQQPFPNIVNMETTTMEMPPQRSNLGQTWDFGLTGPQDVEAGDSGMACLEDVGAGGSNSTSPRLRGSTGLLSDVVGPTRTSRLGNSQLSAVGGGGNISNLPQPEQPFGMVSMANAPMSMMLSQPPILGERAGSSAACAQSADAGELFPLGSAIRSGSSPLHPNSEAGINNSSSLAHQPLSPSAVRMEMDRMRLLSEISNGLALTDQLNVVFRERKVSNQITRLLKQLRSSFMVLISLLEMEGPLAMGVEEMDGWVKRAVPVRQQAVDLLVNIGFTSEQVRQLPKIDISAEQVRQLSKNLCAKRTDSEIDKLLEKMEEVGELIRNLEEESKDFFSQIQLKMMLIEIMKCWSDSSLKELYPFNTSITGVYRPACQQQIDRATGNLRMSVDSDDYQLQYEERRGKWEEIFFEVVVIPMSRFIKRARKFFITVSSVGIQKTYLVAIGEFATGRMKEIDGWLKNAERVRQQAVDIFENIGFTPEQISQLSEIDMSVATRLFNHLLEKQPVKDNLQSLENEVELGKQFRKLKKESEDFFSQTSLERVLIEFMNCRWDSSIKDPLKENLLMQLAC